MVACFTPVMRAIFICESVVFFEQVPHPLDDDRAVWAGPCRGRSVQ